MCALQIVENKHGKKHHKEVKGAERSRTHYREEKERERLKRSGYH